MICPREFTWVVGGDWPLGDAANVRSVILWIAKKNSSSFVWQSIAYMVFQRVLSSLDLYSFAWLLCLCLKKFLPDWIWKHYFCFPMNQHCFSKVLIWDLICLLFEHHWKDYPRQKRLDVFEWSYRLNWHCLKQNDG